MNDNLKNFFCENLVYLPCIENSMDKCVCVYGRIHSTQKKNNIFIAVLNKLMV